MMYHSIFEMDINFFFRFVQYGSKTTWHYMEKNDFDAKSIKKFKQLEQSLAAFRKGKYYFA